MIKDVHTEHCCALHGCKYGLTSRHHDSETGQLKIAVQGDGCPVVSGDKKQSFMCDVCDWEIDESWHEIIALNEMYDRGYVRGRHDARSE